MLVDQEDLVVEVCEVKVDQTEVEVIKEMEQKEMAKIEIHMNLV